MLFGSSDVSSALRNHSIAFIGEFVGTFMFLFTAFAGTQVASEQKDGGVEVLIYIAAAFAASVTVNAWIFFRVSGSAFNPVASLSLWLIGAISVTRAAVASFAHILAGVAASAVVSILFPSPVKFQARLGKGTSIVQGLFIEALLTAQLMLAVLMLAVEKQRATYLVPLVVGIAVFICEIAGARYSGGALSPARAFGPDLVQGDFATYHWIYWVGPTMGSLAATGFYYALKMLKYETCNPGADSDGLDHSHGFDSKV
ncbi:Aquaporin-1 [Ophidiomyces ophidiicola]|uniref:Aquaporin-1 n=1 Tax=Ophidiomyces ophidiicola TaxID=1387563 RepID=A0ACB8V3W3_9EURO|nr:Aquaporin-1 [Ophidiomyces ophidiicola]KAI1924742.1 Aquaporin-1 [Ophidiomyces ophidiicola]KAI1931514.1 Aquaporin-1 [Ophidiomyces ophidiicola]KAI1932873.1 Aquaporin-1 [Ophidiomyces ophidiicola]KAI1943678.1 Aquaporin-1 [Ophidiomyces ophidiicola]